MQHLFLFVGTDPNTDWLAASAVGLDPEGLVLTGDVIASGHLTLETSVSGVFAIGAVRLDSVKRVAAAVGEGAQVVATLDRHLAATLASIVGRPWVLGAPAVSALARVPH